MSKRDLLSPAATLFAAAITSVILVTAISGCSTNENGTAESAALSCVPDQESVCLCGLEEGTQRCTKAGKLGKCECGSSKRGENDEDSAAEEEGKRGASDDEGNPSTPDEKVEPTPKTEKNDPVLACTDTADALAATAQRCAADPVEERAAFVDAAAGGSCSNIRAVRDFNLLYKTCLPWFKTVSCASFLAGIVDPSCQGQLLR